MDKKLKEYSRTSRMMHKRGQTYCCICGKRITEGQLYIQSKTNKGTFDYCEICYSRRERY